MFFNFFASLVLSEEDPLHSSIMNNSTLIDIINKSKEVDPELFDRYFKNMALDQPAYGILILMYSILIALGTFGNTLVILSVIRKPAMRTPRNMFIVNLAISDLLLCTITMPLTLMEILTKYFPLGQSVFICKLIGASQAVSIFVSTISMIAIALDRYQVIVHPTRQSLQLFGAGIILLLIWTISVFLASPLFIYRTLVTENIGRLFDINICYERWPDSLSRYHYSIISFILQYFLPILIVSAAYILILCKLRYRFASGFVANDDPQNSRRQLRGRRLRRTNTLLFSIAIIFFLSWLPLNLYNLIADITGSVDFTNQTNVIAYAVCHMMGMSSACSNPVLYGWLNENFWKEFQGIICIKATAGNSTKRASLRKTTNKTHNKPDLVADFNPGTSVNTEMSLLSKC